MQGLSAQNSVALCLHYDSREEMVKLTGVDPEMIDDDDRRTWPPHKIDRTITIDLLAGGAFTVRDGPRYSEGLSFDEMLGTVAAITMSADRPCLRWLLTKEEHEAREEFYALRKQQIQPETPLE